MRLFVDSSALAAFYCPEPSSRKVEERILSAEKVIVSELAAVELSAALAHKVRARELSSHDRDRVWSAFQEHLGSVQVEVAPLNAATVRLAWELMARHGDERPLRALDALQLASSRLADAESFLCLDKHLAEAAEIEGWSFKTV